MTQKIITAGCSFTKDNYQTTSNRHWSWDGQTVIRSFGKMIHSLQVFNKPNDTFLIDNSQ